MCINTLECHQKRSLSCIPSFHTGRLRRTQSVPRLGQILIVPKLVVPEAEPPLGPWSSTISPLPVGCRGPSRRGEDGGLCGVRHNVFSFRKGGVMRHGPRSHSHWPSPGPAAVQAASLGCAMRRSLGCETPHSARSSPPWLRSPLLQAHGSPLSASTTPPRCLRARRARSWLRSPLLQAHGSPLSASTAPPRCLRAQRARSSRWQIQPRAAPPPSRCRSAPASSEQPAPRTQVAAAASPPGPSRPTFR
jgi:hypothetical protein